MKAKENTKTMAKENEYDEQTVRDLVDWATHANLPKEAKLSEAEYIYDMKLYVEANLYDIEDHYPNSFYNSSITRLIRLREIVEAGDKGE